MSDQIYPEETSPIPTVQEAGGSESQSGRGNEENIPPLPGTESRQEYQCSFILPVLITHPVWKFWNFFNIIIIIIIL
jgi:hypothetical protein